MSLETAQERDGDFLVGHSSECPHKGILPMGCSLCWEELIAKTREESREELLKELEAELPIDKREMLPREEVHKATFDYAAAWNDAIAAVKSLLEGKRKEV